MDGNSILNRGVPKSKTDCTNQTTSKSKARIAMLAETCFVQPTSHPNDAALLETAPSSTCDSSQTFYRKVKPFGQSWGLLRHTFPHGPLSMLEHPSSEAP